MSSEISRRSKGSQRSEEETDERRIRDEEAITFSFPSRIFPAAGLVVSITTIFTSVLLNRYYDHDIGGISWPYLSDTAKTPPESAVFGFGLTLTSVLIASVVTLNYGKIKRDIAICGASNQDGTRRNQIALFLGLVATPFLGLLAVFDTARSPEIHLLFVLGFFPLTVAYVFVNTSIYKTLLRTTDRVHSNPSPPSQKVPPRRPGSKSYVALTTSVKLKRWVSYSLLFFVILYLPVGMSLVSDWYDYRKDATVHTFRAVMQHCSVLCLMLYYGTFWWDFGDIKAKVVQFAGDEK